MGFSGNCIIQGNPAFNAVTTHYASAGLPGSPRYERKLAQFTYFPGAFDTVEAIFLGTEVWPRVLRPPRATRR